MDDKDAPNPHAERVRTIRQRWSLSQEHAEQVEAAGLDDELIDLVVSIFPHTTIGIEGAIGVALDAKKQRMVAQRQKAMRAAKIKPAIPGVRRARRAEPYANKLLAASDRNVTRRKPLWL